VKNSKFHLTAEIFTGIVFISSLVDSQSGSLFGSVWLFRLGWLVMSASTFMAYFEIKKDESNK